MAQHYWRRGYAVICPHLNSAFFDGLVADKFFLAGSLEMLKKCNSIALHPNWNLSSGCNTEHELAVELGLERLYPSIIAYTIKD